MAVVQVYVGTDGSDAADGLSRANRVQTKTRLKAVIAALTPGDTAVINGEGTFWRGVTGWSVNSGTVLDLSSGDTNMQGVTVRATADTDGAAPPLVFSNLHVSTSTANWTDTTTTTTNGTKIWVYTNAQFGGSAVGIGRVWGGNFTTDSNFTRRELWEGGANYTSTFSSIHANLDVIPGDDAAGDCWTAYNAAGTLTANLYIACNVNPVTKYGAITYETREAFAVLSLTTLSNVTIAPSVTVMGAGTYGVYINGCGASGPVYMQAAVKATHRYCEPIALSGSCRNIYLAPDLDPMYRRKVPYYESNITGHNTGSNQISITASCDLSTATGWPEQGLIPGVVLQAQASNGRRTIIRDVVHAGISNVTPSGANVHKFIRIEDGVEFDFKNVPYGRAFALGNASGKTTDVSIGAIIVRNQPTQSQLLGGPRMRVIGARFHSAGNVGNGHVTPWGTPGNNNKAGTSVGIAIYSGTGVDLNGVEVLDCVFECEDGGMSIDTFNSIAWLGNVTVSGCVFIRPGKTPFTTSMSGVARALQMTFETSADEAKLFLRNNILVGFSGACVRKVKTTPSVNTTFTVTDCLASTQNSGWEIYETLADYEQAMRLRGMGQNLITESGEILIA